MNIPIAHIQDFSFVSVSGIVAEARLGVNVDPYARAERGLLAQVWYEGIVGAAWKSGDKEYVKKFDSTVAIYPSPDMHHVVVVLYGSGDPPTTPSS